MYIYMYIMFIYYIYYIYILYYIYCILYIYNIYIYIFYIYNIYIMYIYIYIYIYNLRHENDLTPSRITTQFYISISVLHYVSCSKLSNWHYCSQNNVTIYYQNHITIFGFTNYFKNKIRKSLVDTT